MRRHTAGLFVALCLAIPIAGASTASAASGPGSFTVAVEHAGAAAKGKPFQAVSPVTEVPGDVIMAQ